MQQQYRAQRKRQAGNLGAKAVQRTAEPEAAEVDIAQQRIGVEFFAEVTAQGGVNNVLYFYMVGGAAYKFKP